MPNAFITTLLFLNLPIIPLILARGLRCDRIIFICYLSSLFVAAYLITSPPLPSSLHLVFIFTTLSLLSLNLFYAYLGRPKTKWGCAISFSSLASFPFLLLVLLLLGYMPEVAAGDLYFLNPRYPSLTLGAAALSLIALLVTGERVMRGQADSTGERLFHAGLILWWILYFFLLSKMIYTGDRVPVGFLRLLFGFHLFWLSGTYLLIVKGRFLQVRAHPSPQFLGFTTQSLLVVGIITLFFWFEAWGRTWELPSYAVTTTTITLLAGILMFSLIPLRSLGNLQRVFYHHFYLPDQDFAIEVSHYLKVMRGEETLEKIIERLRKRLNVPSAVLYRADKASTGQWNLYLTSPPQEKVPVTLLAMPPAMQGFGNFPLIEAVPLESREGILGYVLLLGNKAKFDQEEESLIRFWSRTLGLLLQELEVKEREKDQEKLTYFSQATSFLLHDAKNLAQLMDLLLKNAHNLKGEQLTAFFNDSLPALEQARTRARKILEKLETFQPNKSPHLKDADLRDVLHGVVTSLCTSLNNNRVRFYAKNQPFPWKGDPEALRTVMENLILNGLQAGPPEQDVEVALDAEKESYAIQVSDRGEGIPEENQNKIFEPFFTTRRGGSGLGLYQVKILVERIKGRVWYEPNNPKGSVFHVQITKHPDR